MTVAEISEDISEEEFEAAKADALRRWGVIPPSLQRVIDRGGRFRLAAQAKTMAETPLS